MTVVPNAATRAANSWPIRPSPTTPTVLSAISTPVNLLRFHSPARTEASAAGIILATASSSASACSAAVTMFDCGALTTSTPRAVAAGTSTLSRPMPALATTLSTGAAASASASMVVADRIRMASASFKRGQQGAAVGAVNVPDLEFRAEHVHRGLGELLGDQHDGLGHSDSSPWVVRWAPVGAGGIRPWCIEPWCRTRARSALDRLSVRSEQIRRPADHASRLRWADEPAAASGRRSMGPGSLAVP